MRAPVTILKEQATFLGQRTKNIVIVKVFRLETGTSTFKYAFNVVGPAIGNYTYRLFTMSHGAEFYPLTLALHSGLLEAPSTHCPTVTAGGHDTFLASLRRVFADSQTIRVIRAILALSGVEPSE